MKLCAIPVQTSQHAAKSALAWEREKKKARWKNQILCQKRLLAGSSTEERMTLDGIFAQLWGCSDPVWSSWETTHGHSREQFSISPQGNNASLSGHPKGKRIERKSGMSSYCKPASTQAMGLAGALLLTLKERSKPYLGCIKQKCKFCSVEFCRFKAKAL